MKKFRFFSKKDISKLPKSSGIYLFKKEREILYIGKAGNIKERVKNHFQKTSFRDNLFIHQVEKIGYLKTDSEIEALILEAKLIKKYQPKYNIVWRDDKNYFYIGITKENFPRIFITHQPTITDKKSKIQNSKSKISIYQYPKRIKNLKLRKLEFISDFGFKISDLTYIGPFVDGNALKQTLNILRRVFPYRTCKTYPKKPCLWHQLNRCPAPCLIISKNQDLQFLENKIKKECQKNAKNIAEILKGEKEKVVNNLKKEMKKASSVQDFEQAAKIRDQIKLLEKVLKNSKVLNQFFLFDREKEWFQTQKMLKKILKIKNKIEKIEAYDVSNIQGKKATGAMVTFLKGKPEKNLYRRFKIKIKEKPNDVAMLKEILKRRLKHQEWALPDLILIDGGRAQLSAALKSKTKNPKLKNIKIIALAKKENKLFIEDRKMPLLLKKLPREIFNLILNLKDEAHRFALSYHRKLRNLDLKFIF